MLVKLSIAFLLIAAVSAAEETKHRHRYQDPFALLDRHMSMALSHDHSLIPQLATQYFWPWTELAKAVVALDDEEALEEPHVQADPHKFEIKLDVRHFKPDEIKVKVKAKTVIIEGRHIIKNEKLNKKYLANHFVQRYALPVGCEPEEVTAFLKANGVLSVSAPRHRPPPPPEREVPLVIEVIEVAPIREDVRPILVEKRPVAEASKEDDESEESTKEEANPIEENDSEDEPSGQKRLKQELAAMGYSEEASGSKEKELSPVTERAPLEASTFVGKIRKKELKNATKDPKKNETKKPMENNVLDYATVDAE